MNVITHAQIGMQVVGRDYEMKRRPGMITAVKDVTLPWGGVKTMYHVDFDNNKGRRWCTRDEIEAV